METSNIGEYVRLARSGDAYAKEILCRQTYDLAYFNAKKLVKNENDALDIVQESYLKALSSLETLQNDERFTSWLTSIVLNKSKDYLKKKKPKLFVEMRDEDSEMDIDFVDDKITFQPEENVDYSETQKLVGQMVDDLPEDQRACILMYYFNELSVMEIANALGLSENAIKSRLNYGRKKVKTQVLELERTGGVKLYGVAPIPFIVWLLRQQAAHTIIPEAAAQKILETAAGGAGASTAATGAAGAMAAEVAAATTEAVAASTVGTAAAKVISVKLIAGIAAGVVAVSGTAVAVTTYQRNQEEKAAEAVTIDQAQLTGEAGAEAGEAAQASSTPPPIIVYPNEPAKIGASDTVEMETLPESDSLSEEYFTQSILGHDVQFPIEYEDKLIFREGVDSQGDDYARVLYQPLYDRIQGGETFQSKLVEGEVMYTDLWTRNYYDPYIVDWHTKCVAAGSFTDPIPGQRQISFHDDNILVAMFNADTPSSGEMDDPDVADFQRLVEIMQEYCKTEQLRTIPLDQPNYDLYLKDWLEGREIQPQAASSSGYFETILGHTIELPAELEGKLIFATPSYHGSISAYYANSDGTNSGIELDVYGTMSRAEYDAMIKENYQEYLASGDTRMFNSSSASTYPISFNDNSVLFVYSIGGGYAQDSIHEDAYSVYLTLIQYNRSLYEENFPKDQPNYDLYFKGWWHV